MKTSLFLVAAAAATLAAPALANDLALTSDISKSGGSTHSLDYFSAGDAVAIEARIEVAEGVQVDVSKCNKAPPKSHIGSCVYNGKEVVVLLYSMENAPLPSGLIDLGSFSVGSGRAKSGAVASPVVSKFIAASANGGELAARIVSGSGDTLAQ